MLEQEIMAMTLAILRFANLLLAGLPAGDEFGARATALPAPPFRKEKEAYDVTVSSMQEKRGASW
jgi:hypothetical protein